MKPLNLPHGWHVYDPKTGEEQTHGRPILYGLRHGTTDMNEKGLHRGWEDVPLDEDGVGDAQEAATLLSGLGIKRIYTSDLGRARKTASIVGKRLGLKPQVDFRLRPWNKGDFQGEPKDETKEAFDFYVRHPTKKVPGGESLDDFNDRYSKALEQYIEEGQADGPVLIVTHNSNVVGALHWLNANRGAEADKEIVAPGGIFEVSDGFSRLEFQILFKGDGRKQSGS